MTTLNHIDSSIFNEILTNIEDVGIISTNAICMLATLVDASQKHLRYMELKGKEICKNSMGALIELCQLGYLRQVEGEKILHFAPAQNLRIALKRPRMSFGLRINNPLPLFKLALKTSVSSPNERISPFSFLNLDGDLREGNAGEEIENFLHEDSSNGP